MRAIVLCWIRLISGFRSVSQEFSSHLYASAISRNTSISYVVAIMRSFQTLVQGLLSSDATIPTILLKIYYNKIRDFLLLASLSFQSPLPGNTTQGRTTHCLHEAGSAALRTNFFELGGKVENHPRSAKIAVHIVSIAAKRRNKGTAFKVKRQNKALGRAVVRSGFGIFRKR